MQRLVNRATFFQSISHRFLRPLGPSQVNEVEMPALRALDAIADLLRFDLHCEHRVRPRARLVVISGSNVTAFRALPQDIHSLFTLANNFFCDSFNVNSFLQILSNIKRTVRSPKEIDDLLIVDLNERAFDDVIDSCLRDLLFNAFEQMF